MRGPRAEVQALREWGKFYGRSLGEELRLAGQIHLRRHALVALREGRDEIVAAGHDPDADRERIEAELEQLERLAFTKTLPERALAGLGAASDA